MNAIELMGSVGPGVKIAAQMSPEPSEEDLLFAKQVGVDHAVVWTDASKASYEYYAACRERFARAEIRLYGLGNGDVHNQDAIVLGLENRDAKIEEYKAHLRNLGQAGIPYTTYAHMGNGIWSTGRAETARGANGRVFDEGVAKEGHWGGQAYKLPLSHGREYRQEEIWDNFEYFIRQVAPVAEEAGVRIGIHPDDPPCPSLAGIPRCIFSSFNGYARALDMADSPNVGICLCVGCWLEGGELMGRDVLETLRHFGAQGKIFKVHFRNVDKPLPHFVETYVDDGYMDMYQVMKVMHEVGFSGVAIPDHVPSMVGERTGSAYTLAFMRAYLQRAVEEA